MPYNITIHYDNANGFRNPHLHVWHSKSSVTQDLAPSGKDAFGPFFVLQTVRSEFSFKFKDGPGMQGPWEADSLDRGYSWLTLSGGAISPNEVWCVADKAFVYEVAPRAAEPDSAKDFLSKLRFKPGIYVPETGGLSGLGATPLADGRVLFGLYHPNAARVFVMGDFNGWQAPGVSNESPAKFVELKRYQGYFGYPNTWLAVVEAKAGDEYKFVVQGGVPSDAEGHNRREIIDPYARLLGPSFSRNNAVVVDPTTFAWSDGSFHTPDPRDLILYELSVYGFTEGDAGIASKNRGKFAGITERIRKDYFKELGVTALSLMPLAEFPDMQGARTLGYSPSLFCTVERDFGTPDDLRELVNSAHQGGLAVLIDQVFNHASNDFNPLWKLVLEHPLEESGADEGGLYFQGSSPWGNRLATEKEDVQNLLIDSCKLLIREYHIDGFRFDATSTNYMDHGFLLKLASELKALKPDVLLVAENLPNQSDLNRQGYDGFAQWCDSFHDKLKALLREGTFQDCNHYDTDRLGEVFYFSKDIFAGHTNNVVNYVESHDENSVSYEVSWVDVLDNPAAKDRKGRLGLFSAMVALGQPMLYMGGEFNVERERNVVTLDWPSDLSNHGFYQWAKRLIGLRRRYPGLRLFGDDPAGAGQFQWILAPWMDDARGAGRKIVGWRSRPNGHAHDELVVVLNFENQDVTVDLDLGRPGVWVKLADLDSVNDIAPEGTNGADEPTALFSQDGRFGGFNLPSSSGFLFKWQAEA
ncbi:MAG: 1,4-alpha-glucan branching protein [Deltaproteobacteria bacterium]|nr:1,4-alpha-glucan branching protein [Deltaproteobacteria bacterium]